ncbi:MAG: hypothetical protein ABI851_04960 [Saprospiraceae bacterium]
MKINLFIAFSFVIFQAMFAQERGLSSNDSLSIWSDILFTSSLVKTRTIAAEQVELQLKKLLLENKLDSNLLNSNLVRLKIPDKQVEIYSYQFEEEKNRFQYAAYIKLENGKVIQLKRENRDYQRIRREEFDETNWYGAVYYHILPLVFGVDRYYILFGFSQNANGEKFKIIETLKIDNDKIKFGLPVFKIVDDANEEETINRQIIRYSNNSTCLLRYEEEDRQIVYDHIITYDDPNAPNMKFFLPDGSYEAFELNNNNWTYISKLKTESAETAPREKPILDNKSKDLFGKDKKRAK